MDSPESGTAKEHDAQGKMGALVIRPSYPGPSQWGAAIVSNANMVVIGAPFTTVSGNFHSGAAYVSELTNNKTWMDDPSGQERNTPFPITFGYANGQAGTALALLGDTLFIGAPGDIEGHSGGAVYLMQRQAPNKWVQGPILRPRAEGADQHFGSSLALWEGPEGPVLAVGAPGAGGGHVEVFVRNGSDWVFLQSIEDPSLAPGSSFGWSVDIRAPGVLAVGAPKATFHGVTEAGTTYVWRKVEGQWEQDQKLHSHNPTGSAHYGWQVQLLSVAQTNMSLAVSEVDAPYNGTQQAGNVQFYRFTENGTKFLGTLTEGWRLSAEAQFGWSFDVNGTTLAIGAPGAQQPDGKGVVFIFHIFCEEGPQQGVFWPPGGGCAPLCESSNEPVYFGATVRLAGTTLFTSDAGTKADDTPSVYIFRS